MTRFMIPGRDGRWDRLALILEEKGTVSRAAPDRAAPERAASDRAAPGHAASDRIASEQAAPGHAAPEQAAPERTSGERRVTVLPFSAGADEVLRAVEASAPGDLVFAWQPGERERAAAKEREVFLFGCGEDRIYRAQNALATAEGCLAEVLQSRDRTLSGEAVLVCGYGHCGSAIARLFWLCGCEVFVFARARGRREAEADGFNTLSSLFSQECAAFDLVINTIPAAVFPPSILEKFSEGCEFYQVASGNSGVDEAFCRAKGIRYRALPGLPAKYSPQSEAEILAELILDKTGEVKAWR